MFETNLSEKRFNSTDKRNYEIVVKELKIVSKRLDKTAKLLNDVIESEMNVYVKFCTSPKTSPYDDADDNHD